MKKAFLLLGLLSVFGLGLGLVPHSDLVPAYAEGEVADTYTISYSQPEHGKITIAEEDLTGEVGKEVEINIDPDMFYLINSVTVNGNGLIESETTKGLYTFTPVAGENVIAVDIVLNEALFGEFNTLAQDVKNKDWASIFNPENIVKLIFAVVDSGILIAVIIYFVKDKKLSKKVEDAVQDALDQKITPELRNNVANAVTGAISAPIDDLKANNLRIMQGMAVFSKCFALMQENTPESRKAIIDELTSLEIGDMATLEEIKEFIKKEVALKQKEYEENMKALKEIEESNKDEIKEESAEEKEPVKEDNHYDGTEI